MAEGSVRQWQSMTSFDAAEMAKRDPVAVLPLAAIEQHGPHLPLSTDLDIGHGILSEAFRHLPENLPAWVLPPQVVGSSPEHVGFPGTLSIHPDSMIEVIGQLGASLAASGVQRLVLANSHGGNRAAMDVAGLRLRQEESMLVVKASYFRFDRPEDVDLPESEWVHGLHGGAVETAMMMHLRPELVQVDAIPDARSLGEELDGTLKRVSPEGEAPFAWLAGDLNALGVVGNATLGSAAMGKRLVAHYGRAMAEVIQDARAFPRDKLV